MEKSKISATKIGTGMEEMNSLIKLIVHEQKKHENDLNSVVQNLGYLYI